MKYHFTSRQNLAYILSRLGNLFHRFFSAQPRKNGISIMIRVKNEEDWIALSLRSLDNFADEVVIIDNGSTDRTIEIINSENKRLSYPIIIRQNDSPDICKIGNQALSQTSYRWIFRWDADFIAHTSGENNILKLREFLLNLDRKNHYLVYPLTVSFAGDIFHVKKGYELHSENYIQTFHPWLKYKKRGFFEVLKVPFFYKIIRIRKIFFVHIGTAKSLQKMLYRFFWLFWLKEVDLYPKIEDFITYKVEKEWKGKSVRQVLEMKMKEVIISKVRKYDEQEYGKYPALLSSKLENPPFQIVYKKGKPVSRTDLEKSN